MAGPLKANVRFSTEYWMRLAVIAMFGWTTTAEPLLAQTPPAPDPAQQAPGAAGTPAPADQAADVYSMSDLEYLLGPIALYPDPLLALILPASTHPDQIIEAARWLENNAAAVASQRFRGSRRQAMGSIRPGADTFSRHHQNAGRPSRLD